MNHAGRISGIPQQKRWIIPTVWEVCLWASLFLLIAPHTMGSKLHDELLLLIWKGLTASGLLRALSMFSYYGLLYAFGAGLLIYLIFLYCIARSTTDFFAPSVHRVLFSVACLSGWCLLDFLTSTVDFYSFEDTFWVFYPFIIFFIVILLAKESQAILLIKVLLMLLSIQAAYAVVFYLLDIKQFYTPHFGRRTGGTFGDPNILYPICLMGVPLSIALTANAVSRLRQAFYALIALLCLSALFLSYTRTGWLAMIPALLFLGFHSQSPVRTRPYGRNLMLLLSAFLFIATLFVRTQGEIAGNPSDRSFWGRLAIWRVAISGIPEHPLTGYGIGTYSTVQQKYLTPALKDFNPLNIEPKNLYLHLTVERGLLGLGLFLGVVWFVWKLFRVRVSHFPLKDESQAIVMGSSAAFISVLFAGLSDTPIFHQVRLTPTVVVAILIAVSCVLLNRKSFDLEVSTSFLREKQRRFWGRFRVALLILALLLSASWAYMQWIILTVSPQINAYRTGSLSGRPFTPINGISPLLVDCLIASEDGRFYTHSGVDWESLHRAVRVNMRSMSFAQGGSTITMQAARYLFLGRQKTPLRKLAEIPVALEMERRLSKQRILELYFNNARFGLGAEDIGTAANLYFGKSPVELSLAESAFLAGILPEPPATPEEITPEKVERCKNRALKRLQDFFGSRYGLQTIKKAQEQPLRFAFRR
jgi:O-antigen ligase